MSALGHYLEEEGVATVAISLVRAQTENTKPPRALWVPFELGRPFGPPNHPVFQRRVIVAALRLLERERGPVIIEDFPDDDPREWSDPVWRPPLAHGGELEDEIAQLRDAYERSVIRRGRTIVGLSGMPVGEVGALIAAWLRGEPPPTSPNPALSAVLTLRFAIDDLKAYYVEAALDGSSKPSSAQLGDWFWADTAAGRAIFALRRMLAASDDERLKNLAERFLVPGLRLVAGGR